MCEQVTLERIVQAVRDLPEDRAVEVLDFAKRLQGGPTPLQRKNSLLECFSRFHVEMSGFRFDREDANARR